MRLDELRLIAFGRFRDRVLRLGPGLNVVYGPNEAGKSTLVHFIQAMLYGFARPDLKVRRLLPEHARYRPWAAGGYRGALVLTLDGGRQLRVERDFARHQARVYDNVTGEALPFPTDTRGEPLIGETLLGLSRAEFTSTVCIGQLQTARIDPADAEALAARMAALQATGREDESAARALAHLEAREREIGSERARKSPLGAALAELEAVRAEVDRVRRARTENLGREAELRRLQADLAKVQAEEARVGAAIAAARARALEERLGRLLAAAGQAEAAAAEAARLREELAPLAPLAQVDPGEAERVPAYFEAYVAARAREAEVAATLRRQTEEVARLEGELRNLGLPDDAAGLEARLDGLQADVDRLQAQVAAREAAAAARPGAAAPSRALFWILAAVTAVAAVVLALRFSPWALALLLVPAALAWLALRAPSPPPAPDLPGLRDELETRRRELQDLLRQHGCASAGELKGRLRQAAALRAQLDAARAALDRLRPAPAGPVTPDPLDRLLAPLRIAAECSPALAGAVRAGPPTRAAVDAFVRLWTAYREADRRLADAESALERAWERAEAEAADLAAAGHEWAAALAGACSARDPARLREAVAAARAALPPAAPGDGGGEPAPDPRALPDLEARRAALQERVRSLTASLSELQGMIRKAYEDLPDLAELERRQEELAGQVESLERHRRAVARARDILSEVAGRMHRDFAPRLAARVGPIIEVVTGGRYRDVRVGEGLALTTEVPETGELRPAGDLSSGTLDQFYFALRLGAALELTAGGETPPVICDDSLVQYDDDRAAGAIRYLADLARGHQVVLLTCHRAHVEVARDLGAQVVDMTEGAHRAG
ncbi:ATP-binding protein [Caldinitratiruptor microaerophilus]|uniref:YhaN AAA domain-containing protein n=1 Tax=Caldinitratiruptor microaerophilus TaxID=671077 RepID=A0AA35CI53_9FIRM|nr:AAA family ATPase [Caldinitratiruptor microaerophilus]BDG59489.1 hypothetical protein caldi_05790 [Caldinitratiruptor microaerophilus]